MKQFFGILIMASVLVRKEQKPQEPVAEEPTSEQKFAKFRDWRFGKP